MAASSWLSPHDTAGSSRAPASKGPSGALVERYGRSRDTITKWRARTTANDAYRDPSPKLNKSGLHRCLERHGACRRSEGPGRASGRGKLAAATGSVPIDTGEPRLARSKPNMFPAVDRVS